MLSIFSNVFWPFVYLLWKNFYSSLLTIFKIRLFDFVCFWIVGILYIFWILTSCRIYDLQITPSTLELHTVLLPQQFHKQAVTLSPGDRCISEIRLVSPLGTFLTLTVTSDLHMHQSLSLVYSMLTPSRHTYCVSQPSTCTGSTQIFLPLRRQPFPLFSVLSCTKVFKFDVVPFVYLSKHPFFLVPYLRNHWQIQCY